MSDITLAEITRQSKRIREQMQEYNAAADTVVEQLESIATLILNSEDSSANDLNTVMKYAAEAINSIKNATNNNFTYMANMMDKYVSESSENEETASSDIDAVTSAFEETTAALEGLKTF